MLKGERRDVVMGKDITEIFSIYLDSAIYWRRQLIICKLEIKNINYDIKRLRKENRSVEDLKRLRIDKYYERNTYLDNLNRCKQHMINILDYKGDNENEL